MGKWRFKKKTELFTSRKRFMKKKDLKVSYLVPELVLGDIFKHIDIQTKSSEKKYINNQGKEDAVTGSLFSLLQADWKTVDDWSWNIDYEITNQSAKGTFNEKETGADGIVSINIKHNGKIDTKSILFQAKKGNNTKGLNEQIRKMDSHLSGGNMVILYSTNGFYAQDSKTFKISDTEQTKLDDYLKNVFFACKCGSWGRNTYLSDDKPINLYCLDINITDDDDREFKKGLS
jgi:hypothetical protein